MENLLFLGGPILKHIRVALRSQCLRYQELTINNQGCHSQGKNIWKMKFFLVREKSGNFVDGQGNLERI